MEDYEKELKMDKRRKQMREESHKEVSYILTLSGFTIKCMWELYNGYWPDSPEYDEFRTPWWLVLTDVGLIRFGQRKRVLDIDWSATKLRSTVTTDNVTKDPTMVHAWTSVDAVKYLRCLREAMAPQKGD